MNSYDPGLLIMTDEELIRRIHESRESSSSMVETEVLIERYKPIVKRLAKAYYIVGADREDLVQEGMIGLYKAVVDYRSNMGARFRSFAHLCMVRQITDAVRASLREKQKPLNQAVSLDQVIPDEDGVERSMIDLLPDETSLSPEERAVSQSAEKELLNMIEGRLSKMEHKVLLLYLKDPDYQAIAKELGMSPKAVDNAIQRIRRKVREQTLEGEEET
ncbi:MAG: sigma-70 family RNA polymerase sigma factor [Firmicutes bacterium]|nr:sigma-70 family RNA polymerase sigma factor [Bacillota bacterium]